MTELRVTLKRRELEHLYRHRDQFFRSANASYMSGLIRAKFIWALENLNYELHLDQPASHQRKTPTPLPDLGLTSSPDPYTGEPDEDA
jgi:hypothetical protein